MNTKRRNLLLATGGAISVAGCYGALRHRSTNQEQENTDNEDSMTENTTTSEVPEEDEPEQTNNTDEPTEDTDEPQTDESTEEGNESEYDPEEDDRQRRPQENETEPEGNYTRTGEHEVERLPESYVEVSITEDDITLTRTEILVTGRVEKTTDERVDFVDVEILFCNSTGGVLGTSLVVVRELPSDFETRISMMELRGEGDFDNVRWNVLPQRYVEGE